MSAVLAVIFIVSCLFAITTSRVSDGYPSGYLSDCPGSKKPAIILPKTLAHLSITVEGPGLLHFESNKYTFYQAKELANDTNLDFKRRTFLYVGGYMDSPNFVMAKLIAKFYKNLGYNILLLDTNRFTTMPYPVASRYVRVVGKHVAKMLVELTYSGLNPKKLEIAGISLGAQTMSFIAKNYQTYTGRNISRITAFDPAGPCFRNLGPKDRLDKTDADFVDVINTNIDGFGFARPIGHVNFYVNGGEYQPGEAVVSFCTILCSHIRSFTLWLAALQYPDSFIAIQCDSVQQARDRNCYDRIPQVTNLLGLKTDRNTHGIFYLSTRNVYPYFMGLRGTKREYDFFDKFLRGLNEVDVIKT